MQTTLAACQAKGFISQQWKRVDICCPHPDVFNRGKMILPLYPWRQSKHLENTEQAIDEE